MAAPGDGVLLDGGGLDVTTALDVVGEERRQRFEQKVHGVTTARRVLSLWPSYKGG